MIVDHNNILTIAPDDAIVAYDILLKELGDPMVHATSSFPFRWAGWYWQRVKIGFGGKIDRRDYKSVSLKKPIVDFNEIENLQTGDLAIITCRKFIKLGSLEAGELFVQNLLRRKK